ncbi:methyltransferase [Enterobacter sp. 638]|uniref:Hydroxyneurosporene-O-methyltransferase n=1 Tax=Enterobacter sp. (strain 638) TaxID=399742 RepID=A0A9J9GG38_ENT38|nr:methyltransferase [Enterobacter sp. 638]ABP60603.1 hydroxyneurosporene-O-methyltransferase [Enterobacter sp. 638]
MLTQTNLSEVERKDAVYLLEQSMGFVWQASLRAAAELGVADRLLDGDKTAGQLGDELNVDGVFLQRVMRILSSRKVFHESPDGLFSLTPAARFLCTNHNHSLRAAVLMLTDKTFWQPAAEISDIVAGKQVFKDLFGMSFYDYWGQDSSATRENVFHAGMSSMSSVENEVLVECYDFPEGATVVDIAGGFGNLLLNVLRRNPSLNGILFDQENVLAGNRLHLLGDDTRWTTVAGSFFEACPQADIYLLKYILMDWPDAQASKILQTCRKSMKPNSRLLILEPVIKDNNNEPGRYQIDLLLLTSFDGGRARTEQEYADMLADAGLKLNRVIHTPSYLSIIEAVLA